jgi:sec-independent protein translocase protein TatB
MGAMHFADSIVIFLLALILFGPKKLPEIARQVGKLMMEFRRASNEFKSQIDDELRAMEQQDRQKKLEAAAAQTPTLAAGETASAELEGSEEEDDSYRRRPLEEDSYEDEDEMEDSAEPAILPPSSGETINADWPRKPSMPVAPTELLEKAATDPHPVYAEALAAEQNGSSNHTGPEPESAQAIVNHG